MPKTVIEAAAALSGGRTSSAALIAEALARIAAPAGEGSRAFMTVHGEAARATAAAMDSLRKVGRAPSAYA
ncbi:MAG: amidase, partial [Alphaproteobacteria bacterium]